MTGPVNVSLSELFGVLLSALFGIPGAGAFVRESVAVWCSRLIPQRSRGYWRDRVPEGSAVPNSVQNSTPSNLQSDTLSMSDSFAAMLNGIAQQGVVLAASRNRRDFLINAGIVAALLAACTTTACSSGEQTATEGQSQGSEPPQESRVSISVSSIQYKYDRPWGSFDVASSATALSEDGSVVAEARITTPFPSTGGLSGGLDVEEVIYRGGTRQVVATGSIHFDTEGRVTSYRSTSGMLSPVFNRWPTQPGN
jgi:hypothetical protein